MALCRTISALRPPLEYGHHRLNGNLCGQAQTQEMGEETRFAIDGLSDD
jgi:hypothetical protein